MTQSVDPQRSYLVVNHYKVLGLTISLPFFMVSRLSNYLTA